MFFDLFLNIITLGACNKSILYFPFTLYDIIVLCWWSGKCYQERSFIQVTFFMKARGRVIFVLTHLYVKLYAIGNINSFCYMFLQITGILYDLKQNTSLFFQFIKSKKVYGVSKTYLDQSLLMKKYM